MRLIDADLLKKNCKCTDEFEDNFKCVSLNELAKVIDEQPIAYDVDKVVEQLENTFDNPELLQEETKMINLANKCVLIRTHEEYENILKAAKKQGYRWYGGKEVYPYPFEEQQIPDILKFYSNKELTRNASLAPGYELVEASDVIEDEEKLKDAISLVRMFAKYPDRTALTDTFIESLKLLADTVESQMKEVK